MSETVAVDELVTHVLTDAPTTTGERAESLEVLSKHRRFLRFPRDLTPRAGRPRDRSPAGCSWAA